MKRKLLLIAVAGVFSAGVAHAENTGCGLGTTIWEGQSGLAPEVLAVTTNGTLGNQTFGITFGTLGCKKDGVVRSPMAMFTGSNMDRLARDMSIGEGEALETLAELIGIDTAHKGAFYQSVKANFDTIFPTADVTAEQVLDGLRQVMAQDAVLARYAV
jgi:hypothetical protein